MRIPYSIPIEGSYQDYHAFRGQIEAAILKEIRTKTGAHPQHLRVEVGRGDWKIIEPPLFTDPPDRFVYSGYIRFEEDGGESLSAHCWRSKIDVTITDGTGFDSFEHQYQSDAVSILTE